jgi:hypothetical protein
MNPSEDRGEDFLVIRTNLLGGLPETAIRSSQKYSIGSMASPPAPQHPEHPAYAGSNTPISGSRDTSVGGFLDR